MTTSWPAGLPLVADVDVCVVGSGSAGSTAAIAAERGGASVGLVEKLPFLGGTSTAVLDTFYGFYTPGDARRKVVGGIPDEVVARLRALGPVLERPNTYGAGTGITYLGEHLKAGRRQALEYARFLVDRVPGYERASLVALGTQVGIRETRRVYGDARLTGDDVLAARQFDDQIGLCGAPIEDHRAGPDTRWAYIPNGGVVGIPYAALVVRDAVNVLLAGRCFSATHDAHAPVRSMAQCMAMGQAAGTAAAMAVAGNGVVRDVAHPALRDRLAADGAILGLDAATKIHA